MRVLAIDTTLEACSAAVLDTEVPAQAAQESAPMTRGHAEAIMPMIARVLDRAGIAAGDLDRIAVTVGPGSFTGLRVGIAAARGIALAAGKPAIGLTTLAAYAAPLIAADDSRSVVSTIDAHHDRVYIQIFGPGGRIAMSPRLLSLHEAARAAHSSAPRLIGTGAELLAKAWLPGEKPPASIDNARAPDIGWVAWLGAAAAPSSKPPKPLYLRPPDAQPQAAARLPRR